MRRVRPDETATVAPIRGALLRALAFSAGAATCALALPLLVLHIGLSLTSPPAPLALALVVVFCTAVLLVRVAFVSARRRTLDRAALWLDQARGAELLALGLSSVRAPNDFAQDRKALTTLTGALSRADLWCDAAVVAIPLAALAIIAPPFAAITLVTGLALLLLASRNLRRLDRDSTIAASRMRDADACWHTAAGSCVVVAARGMTASTVDEWQTTNARGLARQFAVTRACETISTTADILHIGSWVAVLGLVGAGLVDIPSMATLAVVILLHESVLRPLVRLTQDLGPILATRRALDTLGTSPATPLQAPRAAPAPSPAARNAPHPHQTYRAEAS